MHIRQKILHKWVWVGHMEPLLLPLVSNQTLSFMTAIGESLDKVCSHYATKNHSRRANYCLRTRIIRADLAVSICKLATELAIASKLLQAEYHVIARAVTIAQNKTFN